ncbi:hypothetical protein N9544_00845 [Flavobacteriales bacterium]|nr:hypothetical protein [Flavobacteriales bacterium]
MKFNKEFKDAVLQLSQIEKDKLLIRLLKKDKVFSKQLQFELLDNNSTDERQLLMEDIIKEKVAYFATKRYTPTYLLKRLRSVSTLITEHVKITKDKMGDSYLNLILLTETLETFNIKLEKTTPGQSRKLGIYFVSKAFKILIGITKLHEDYFLEYRDNLEKLGKLFINNKHMMRTAIQNGFDVNWLLTTEYPEDIEDIYKEIKAAGYLSSKTHLNVPAYKQDDF